MSYYHRFNVVFVDLEMRIEKFMSMYTYTYMNMIVCIGVLKVLTAWVCGVWSPLAREQALILGLSLLVDTDVVRWTSWCDICVQVRRRTTPTNTAV